MKKLLFIICGFYSLNADAQNWTKYLDDRPRKMKDIVAAYERENERNEAREAKSNSLSAQKGATENVEEDENYHFDRWKWYWEQHTDVNGYLISPMKKLEEWNKLRAKRLQSQFKTTATNKSAWTFQGPDKSNSGYSGIGRINVICFHPTDTATIWIGSAGGGTWKTTNSGLTWTSLGDQFPVMGVADIDLNPLNPNTVYICTGDRDANDTYSVGVLKSTNGGSSWDTTGIKWPVSAFRLATCLLINASDTNSLTLATTAGIYKSYNGGQIWTQSMTGEFKQLLYHPTDTNIIYAAGFSSGTNQVFRSSDGGATWTQQSNFPSNSRIAMAVTPINVALLKVIVSNPSHGLEGIYNSTDTGKTFTKIYTATGTSCDGNILVGSPSGNGCGGQGWYDLTIAISPVDDQKVVVGGINTWFSTNGGSSWTIANQWQNTLPGIKVVHADKHFHAYHPLMPNVLFEANDGGVYRTSNPVSSLWTDLTNGLGITQFYRNAVANVASFTLGGAQDNGTKKITASGPSDLTGGDGMNCEIDQTNASIFYTSQQYGELRRTKNGGTNFTDISNNIPGSPKGDWITPFAIHPNSNNFIVAAYNYVYLSDDMGDSWNAISPNFGTNAKRICFAMQDDNTIYVLVNNIIQKTSNMGSNWSVIGGKPAGTVSDIIADYKNAKRIIITYSGYAGTSTDGRVAEYTPDSGWKLLNENLPNIPIYCITQDTSDGTFYIGTDFGVFYRDATMSQWEEYNSGLPNIEVTDLGINYTTNEIWAATYGRGMWKSPRNGIPVNIKTIIPYADNIITVSPNPNYGRFTLHTNDKTLHNKNAVVRVVNVNGAISAQKDIVIAANGTEINVDLPRGTYIVELIYNSSIVAKKRIVIY